MQSKSISRKRKLVEANNGSVSLTETKQPHHNRLLLETTNMERVLSDAAEADAAQVPGGDSTAIPPVLGQEGEVQYPCLYSGSLPSSKAILPDSKSPIQRASLVRRGRRWRNSRTPTTINEIRETIARKSSPTIPEDVLLAIGALKGQLSERGNNNNLLHSSKEDLLSQLERKLCLELCVHSRRRKLTSKRKY